MKIAVGNSRMDKKWKNREISWEELCKKVSVTIRTTETVQEYRKLKKGAQDSIKDVGGFVGGSLREGRRKNGMVLCRSMLTLDMDYGKPGIWDEIIMLHSFKCCVYSTHKHTPEYPRLRLLIPLSREVSEEEYPAVARMVAREIGIDLFDDTTYEACRLMYWPSTSINGEFFFQTMDGDLLDPDHYLSMYTDWKDTSTWPVSSRQSEAVRRSISQQADPLTKPGVVGAFCRAYTIEDAIETFLADTYTPSAMNGRYDYIPADSSAGVVIYDNKFAYSHHATDPVCGKLLNAFDIVRLHRFGDLDDKVDPNTPVSKLPSFTAMSDFALKDDRVKAVFAEERLTQANTEFQNEDWQSQLEIDRTGAVKDTLTNICIILRHDPNLKGIVFNQFKSMLDDYLESYGYEGIYTQLANEDAFQKLDAALRQYAGGGVSGMWDYDIEADVADLKSIAFDYIRLGIEQTNFRDIIRKPTGTNPCSSFFACKDIWQAVNSTIAYDNPQMPR